MAFVNETDDHLVIVGKTYDASRLTTNKENIFINDALTREAQGNTRHNARKLPRVSANYNRSESVSPMQPYDVSHRTQHHQQQQGKGNLLRRYPSKQTKNGELVSRKMSAITAKTRSANDKVDTNAGPRMVRVPESSNQMIKNVKMNTITAKTRPANDKVYTYTATGMQRTPISSNQPTKEVEVIHSKPARQSILANYAQPGLRKDVYLNEISSKEKKHRQRSFVVEPVLKSTHRKEVNVARISMENDASSILDKKNTPKYTSTVFHLKTIKTADSEELKHVDSVENHNIIEKCPISISEANVQLPIPQQDKNQEIPIVKPKYLLPLAPPEVEELKLKMSVEIGTFNEQKQRLNITSDAETQKSAMSPMKQRPKIMSDAETQKLAMSPMKLRPKITSDVETQQSATSPMQSMYGLSKFNSVASLHAENACTKPHQTPTTELNPSISAVSPNVFETVSQHELTASLQDITPISEKSPVQPVSLYPIHFPLGTTLMDEIRQRNGSVKIPSPFNQISHRIETNANLADFPPISHRKTIIIDIGHYYVRAGILRTKPSAPEICFPNVRSVTQSTEPLDTVSSERKRSVNVKVGEKVLHDLLYNLKEQNNVIYPLRQKQIGEPSTTNAIETENAILTEIFARLNVKSCEYKVLFCLPTRASCLRPCLISSLFDEFGVRGVASLSAFRATLQTAKTPTCFIINFSSDLEIIPVVEGVLIENGRVLSSLYIDHVLDVMMMNLRDANITLSTEEITCYGHFIFQHSAFVKNSVSISKDVEVDFSECKPCPSVRKIVIPAHLRQSCTEGIFNPKQNEHFDPNSISLQKMLKRSLKACALDARQELCSNVLLMGEYANLEGLQHRIVKEMQEFLPKSTILKVRTVPNAEEAVFVGACLTGTLMQVPQMPKAKWFKFIRAIDWREMKATAPFGTPLQNRLNTDSVWP